MAIVYFKCGNIRTKHYLSTGAMLKFTPVTNDVGVIAINDDKAIEEIRLCIREQRGGYFEITEAEYKELKKNPILGTPWREELSGRGIEKNKVPINRQPQTQIRLDDGQVVVEVDPPKETPPEVLERPKAVPRKPLEVAP